MNQWQPARLLTPAGIDSATRARARAVEALLATIPIVPGYAGVLLGSAGVRVDARTKVATFVGVRLGAGRSPVADGVIQVTKGRSTWKAAVVARAGSETLTATAFKSVRTAAKKAGFDALITISNDPQGPDLGRSKTATPVVHWPWGTLISAAVDQKLRDDEQAHLLGELVTFLSDPDAKVVSFGDMGPSWSAVVKTARTSRLSDRDAGVVDVCGRWDQVLRHAAATLSRTTGRDVQQVMSAAHRRDPAKRVDAMVATLVSDARLEGVLDVTDAAGELAVVADLRGQRLVSVVVAKPPAGLGARATVGWLLDGLAQASSDAVVESWAKGGRQPLAAATLADLDRDMRLLDGPRGRGGDQYRVLLATEMATARATSARSSGFVDSVNELVAQTWTSILGPLSGDMAASARSGSTKRPAGRQAPKRTSTKRTTKKRTTSTSARTSRHGRERRVRPAASQRPAQRPSVRRRSDPRRRGPGGDGSQLPISHASYAASSEAKGAFVGRA